MAPLILRAHHINSAKLLFKTPREKIIEVMGEFEYIDNQFDPFINIVYRNLKDYFERLSQKIRLKIGGLDIICESCKKHERNICKPNRTGKYSIFSSGNSYGRDADVQILDKYGLKIDRTYTVKEIRQAANF